MSKGLKYYRTYKNVDIFDEHKQKTGNFVMVTISGSIIKVKAKKHRLLEQYTTKNHVVRIAKMKSNKIEEFIDTEKQKYNVISIRFI